MYRERLIYLGLRRHVQIEEYYKNNYKDGTTCVAIGVARLFWHTSRSPVDLSKIRSLKRQT